MSDAENLLMLYIRESGLPEPIREYRFHPTRKWRFDFAWKEKKLAVEVEGGQYIRGRHNRPVGYERDCEKYNNAVMLGWKVLRFTPSMIYSGDAINCIEILYRMV